MAEAEPNALSTVHQYRLPPPSFEGDYALFEEWKFKFIAYLGLKHPTFPQLLTRAEASTVVITDAVLTGTAGEEEEAAIREQQQPSLDSRASTPMASKPGDNSISGLPSQSAPVPSGISPNSSSPSLKSIDSKNRLHHGNTRSTDMNATTEQHWQTTSRLQCCSTRQKEHFNNIYN